MEQPEVEVVVRKTWVKNFKSLKDFKLDLNKVNIIVGKNGSGKTNLIEALKLFKKTVDFLRGKEVNPFLDWWGYDNVVWSRDERLPITIGFEYTVKRDRVKTPARYSITVSGRGGSFSILQEEIEIPNTIKIRIEPNSAIVFFEKKELEKILKKISKGKAYIPWRFLVPRGYLYDSYVQLLKDRGEYNPELKTKDIIEMAEEELFNELKILKQEYFKKLMKNPVVKVEFDGFLLDSVSDTLKFTNDIDVVQDLFTDIIGEGVKNNFEKYLINHLESIVDVYNLNLIQMILFKASSDRGHEETNEQLFKILRHSLREFDGYYYLLALATIGVYTIADRSVILKRLDYKTIREPVKLRKELTLAEDGSNLASVLYSSSKGRIPPRIQRAIERSFGTNCTVYLEPTTDGRIYIKFYENGKEWNPPSIPDGLYKLIALELALEYKAPIIAVDEMENSLHADVIRYFIDEVKTSSSIAILTTHSPAVMDFSDPQEIIIFQRNADGETKPFRFTNPEQIKKILAEEGVTLSEYILYNEMSGE